MFVYITCVIIVLSPRVIGGENGEITTAWTATIATGGGVSSHNAFSRVQDEEDAAGPRSIHCDIIAFVFIFSLFLLSAHATLQIGYINLYAPSLLPPSVVPRARSTSDVSSTFSSYAFYPLLFYSSYIVRYKVVINCMIFF